MNAETVREILGRYADSCANKRDAALERDDAAMACYWRSEIAETREAIEWTKTRD